MNAGCRRFLVVCSLLLVVSSAGAASSNAAASGNGAAGGNDVAATQAEAAGKRAVASNGAALTQREAAGKRAAASKSTAAGNSAAAPNGAAAGVTRWSNLADTQFRRLTSTEMRFAGAMTQDGDGFLWLATQDGLVRWDGYRSRIYHADPQDKASLPGNWVTCLHTDQRGHLWVGTAVGGLARYDPERDAFEIVGGGPGGLRSPNVTVIAADGSTGLWIGTGDGLDHIDLETRVVSHVSVGPDHDDAVMAVLTDGFGSLWVGTERGLMLKGAGGEQFSRVSLGAAAGGAAPAVVALSRDSGGNLWIGTRQQGAYVIVSGQMVARPVHETGGESPLDGELVNSIVEVKPGEVWLGTGGGGIVIVDTTAGWVTRRLRNHLGVATSLQDDYVFTMYRDRSGLIWVATTMAMNVHDPRQTGISTLFGVAGGDRPITAVQVSFVLPQADGRVWVSAGDAGDIDILDPIAGRVGRLRADPSQPASRLPGRVLTMVTAPDGDVYIGTRKGLYRADPSGKRVERVEIAQRAVDLTVWSLYLDGEVLWLGGTDGLWALNLAVPGAPPVLRHEAAERLGNQRVSALLRGAGDTLWVGTAVGMYRLDIASDELQRLPTNAGDPTALLPGYVSSLLLDARGRLWVASIGSGIQVLVGRDPDGRSRFRRLGMREGLPHNGIDKLLPDAQGRIWASTDNGLAVIDPATFAVRVLGAPQGVPILEYWANSGARTAAGEVLFGGEGGLTVVRPQSTAGLHYPAPVVITELHAGGKLVPASGFNGATAPRLDIGAADRSLMVEFAALDFAAPEDNHYSYRLEGFDKEWVASQATRRLATYTNLPPGKYTLQLRGSDHEAPWTTATRELHIRVLPAWYQTAWFRSAAAVLAVLGLLGLLQLRTTYLRARQRELQDLVTQRTVELKQRGVELEQRRAELEQRSAELEQSSAALEQRSVELRESQQQLERIAYLDPLTGIANRRLFDTELAHLTALAMRGSGNFTLLLIDLDRFKHINDSLGHDAGDALLIEITRRLDMVLRQSDRKFRLGGDEFAVLLAETGEAAGAEAACQRIVEALARPFALGDHTLSPGASIGAARWSTAAAGPDALYKCADLALYEAKRAGRNTWRWHLPAARAELKLQESS